MVSSEISESFDRIGWLECKTLARMRGLFRLATLDKLYMVNAITIKTTKGYFTLILIEKIFSFNNKTILNHQNGFIPSGHNTIFNKESLFSVTYIYITISLPTGVRQRLYSPFRKDIY